MPRLKKVPCAQCDAKMAAETSFCPNCEQPTIWASPEERTEWELHQWNKKRSSRPKRRVSTEVAEVTPILSPRAPTPAPARAKPIVKHPAAARVAQAAPAAATPKARRATKPVAERVTPPVPPQKKNVARSKPEPERAPAKRAARRPATAAARAVPAAPAAPVAPAAEVAPAAPVASAPEVVQAAPVPSAPEVVQAAPLVIPPATIDLDVAPPSPDHAAEQTELLRELLRHVISIEEKINGNGQRRLRLLKR